MATSDTVFVDPDAHNEELFHLWIQRFDTSLELLLKERDAADPSSARLLAEFSKKLLACIDSEHNQYPSWVDASILDDIDTNVVLPQDDLKDRVRQLMLPSALSHFQRLLSSEHNECVLLQCGLSSSDERNRYALQIEKLLRHLDHCCHDDFVALCRLCETHQRLYMASDRDTRRVNAWLQTESNRFIASSTLTQDLTRRYEQLERIPGTLISTGLDKIKEVCGEKEKLLQQAIDEEEAARKALEEAKRRKQEALHNTLSVKALYSRLEQESQKVRNLTEKRLEIEKYNAQSAKGREELLSLYNVFLGMAQQEVFNKDLGVTVPLMLRSLFYSVVQSLWPSDSLPSTDLSAAQHSIFGPLHILTSEEKRNYALNSIDVIAHNTEGMVPSNEEKLACMARLGLEMIRLWKQLNVTTYYKDVCEILSEFEGFFSSRANTISLEQTTSPVPKHINKTIVLYYDHYEHGTPAGHIECNARYTEAMAALRSQANDFVVSDVDVDAKRLCIRKRDIILLQCEDVVSPPLWILPLIHSTAYLKSLGNYSKEAQEGDLYVPVEFHSEYEEDSESDKDSDVDTALPFHWDSTADALGSLKEELEALLRPHKGDKVIQELLFPSVKPRGSHHHRQRHSVSIYEPRHGRASRKQLERMENTHVSTPLGRGVVVQAARPADNIITVKLEFGAIGYFHTSAVRLWDSSEKHLDTSIRQALDSWRMSLPADASEDQLHQADSVDQYLDDIIDVMLSASKKYRVVADTLDVPPNVLRGWLDDTTTPWLRDIILLKAKAVLAKDTFDTVINRIKNANVALKVPKIDENTVSLNIIDISANIQQSTEAEKLRFLTRTIQTRLGISQTQFGVTVSKKEPIRQAKVSAWYCDRMERRLSTRMSHYAYDWLQQQISQMTKDEKIMFDSLSDWIKTVPFLEREDKPRGRPPMYEFYFAEQVIGGRVGSTVNAKRQSKPKKPVLPRSVAHSTISAHSDGALIETFKDYLSANHITQTQAAEMLAAQFPVKANQNMISGWTRRVTSEKITQKLNQFIRQWLQQRGCDVPPPSTTEMKLEGTSTIGALSGMSTIIPSHMSTDDVPNAVEVGKSVDDCTVSSNTSNPDPVSMETCGDDIGSDIDIFSSSDSDIFSSENNHHDVSLSIAADTSIFDSDSEDPTPQVTISAPRTTLAASRSRRQRNKRSHSDYYYDDASQYVISSLSDDQSVTASESNDEDEDISFSCHPLKRIKLESKLDSAYNNLRSRVISEMRRRDLSQARAREEIAADMEVHIFSRFLNGAHTSPSLEASMESWLQKSEDKPGVERKDTSESKACGFCGRRELDFSSYMGFARHITWCRVKNEARPVKIDQLVVKNQSNNSVEKIPNRYVQPVMTSVAPAKDHYKGRPIMVADAVKPQIHYLNCEECKKQDAAPTAKCASCPCKYHYECISKSGDIPPEPWYCPKCMESGANIASPLSNEDLPRLSEQKWILIFSNSLRRWRQGYVIEIDSDTGFYLCRWWRLDAKWGKCSYVDASSADVLWSLNLRGPTMTQPPKLNPSDENQATLSKNPRNDKQENQPPRKVGRPRTRDIPERNTFEDNDIATDTYVGAESLRAALCTLGVACRAIDYVINGENTNAFLCTRPPGHHAGRRGCTANCLGTGFCLMNNAAAAVVYARVRWGLERVAVVDIDAHFGNGTAELLRGDPKSFFGCVHMIYGDHNRGFNKNACCGNDSFENGFFPATLGCTEILDNYVSLGVFPQKGRESGENVFGGPDGFRRAVAEVLLPKLEKFDPQLLIISAGFDGYSSDPLGGELGLSVDDITWITCQLGNSMHRPGSAGAGRIVSFLEGGYDTSKKSAGLASSVDAHVRALRSSN